jgi:chemotaxis protein methyltransferase CheR
MSSHDEYCEFVFSEAGQRQELIHMIDVVTTNKTEFFREPSHFDYLSKVAVPAIIEHHGLGGRSSKLKIWSAGCSTGEEPYTLAMVLSEFREARGETAPEVEIFATDISTRVLEHARKAIYAEERIHPIPESLRRKYLLRSRDRSSGLVRIDAALRGMLRFGRLNFMDEDFGLRERFQVIFCRNVIIYFDKPTQERLMHKFCRHLVDGGYLFLGHSESLHGFHLPLRQVAPTVYQRD